MENDSALRRATRQLNSTREQGRIAKNDYLAAFQANQANQPVAWSTAYFPAELVYAFDIPIMYPENYSCLCAAKGESVNFCQVAESQGYSKDLCSYFRTTVGSLLTGKSTLRHDLPKPDFLLATTGNCDPHLKWFEYLSEYFNRPLFVLDVPYNVSCGGVEDVDQKSIDYYVDQLQDLIAFLEKHTGKKFDAQKLERRIELSDQAGALWLDILEYRKNKPTPMGAEDAFTAVYLLVSNAGTEGAVEYFTKLRDEVRERVEQGVSLIAEEKYRLLWDWLPMWYNMSLLNYFEEKGAVFPVEYFTLKWACRLDKKKPFESLARKYISLTWGNSPLTLKEDIVLRAAQEYKIDGIVLHSNWSCRAYCIGQVDLKNLVYEKLGLPGLIIDSDMADARHFSEAQVKTRIDAFFEALAERTGR
ncbi:2-hydroxyacyl-CoA dehydratase subunit D [Paradesulfitobacterium aromaticivorans]